MLTYGQKIERLEIKFMDSKHYSQDKHMQFLRTFDEATEHIEPEEDDNCIQWITDELNKNEAKRLFRNLYKLVYSAA